MTSPLLQGFPPIVDDDARVLILGSFRCALSLAEHQYYARPRNAFWPITRELSASNQTRRMTDGSISSRPRSPAGVRRDEVVHIQRGHPVGGERHGLLKCTTASLIC